MADGLLRIATALLVLIGGTVHLAEWLELFRYLPTIGPLFLVNVISVIGVAALLFVRRGWAGILGAMVLSAGTLGGLLMARYGSVLGYSETRWRTAAVLAAAVEVAAIATATTAAVLRGTRRS